MSFYVIIIICRLVIGSFACALGITLSTTALMKKTYDENYRSRTA